MALLEHRQWSVKHLLFVQRVVSLAPMLTLLRAPQVGSNPLDADCAMMMLKAIEENDSCAIKHLDLAVRISARFAEFKMCAREIP